MALRMTDGAPGFFHRKMFIKKFHNSDVSFYLCRNPRIKWPTANTYQIYKMTIGQLFKLSFFEY